MVLSILVDWELGHNRVDRFRARKKGVIRIAVVPPSPPTPRAFRRPHSTPRTQPLSPPPLPLPPSPSYLPSHSGSKFPFRF